MNKHLAAAAAVAALLVAAPAAQADHVPSNLGIEVTAVDPASRTVTGIQHCTSPDRAGRAASFPVTPGIDFGQFHPGMVSGIAVDPGGVILSTGAMPCDVLPSEAHPAPGGPEGLHGSGPGLQGPGGHDGDGAGMMTFARGFLNRVWKFGVEIDSAEGGRVDVTIGKVLNLPKRMRAGADALVDEAAIVLVDKKVRVYDEGKRVPQSSLEDAEGDAVIHAKLLPPQKWQEDQDGEPVPTVRARKIRL